MFSGNPPLGLYVHLPWCVQKCPYCDFNSHAAESIPEQEYVDALLDDLAQDLPLVWGRSIDTMFIGGGTPSLVSPADLGIDLDVDETGDTFARGRLSTAGITPSRSLEDDLVVETPELPKHAEMPPRG